MSKELLRRFLWPHRAPIGYVLAGTLLFGASFFVPAQSLARIDALLAGTIYAGVAYAWAQRRMIHAFREAASKGSKEQFERSAALFNEAIEKLQERGLVHPGIEVKFSPHEDGIALNVSEREGGDGEAPSKETVN